MAKYKLSMKENNYKNILEFNSDDLSDVIANIEIFLKGNGFIFDGHLDIHEGETQMNAMHYIPRYTSDREFDDIITDSDQLDMEIKEDGNTTDTQK
jgi:hypothetical protein